MLGLLVLEVLYLKWRSSNSRGNWTDLVVSLLLLFAPVVLLLFGLTWF